MFRTLNPATQAVVATFDADPPARIEQALEDASAAQRRWARESLASRAAAVARVGEALLCRKAELAALITLEMGKPIVESEAEVEKAAWTCRFYAEHAADYLRDETI